MSEIYTDGACSGNGTEHATGGWAAVVYEDGVLVSATAGREENTTNNICELKAILWAQGYYGHRHPIVYSDSAYAINSLTLWKDGWKANGWKRAKGEVKNLELIQAYDTMESLGLTVTLKKVKGHADCEGNILADKLATGQLTIAQVMNR